MKNTYSTPIIKIEDLSKHDVLCDSAPKPDNGTKGYSLLQNFRDFILGTG